MDRSKLYTIRPITIDFNPKDIEPEDRDETAVLAVEFMPNALSPKLRRALGEMVDKQEEATRIIGLVADGGATPVEAKNAEQAAEQAEKDFTSGLARVIHSWDLTDGGVAIPFTLDALESEGYEFIYKLSSGIFGALSPNLETENK